MFNWHHDDHNSMFLDSVNDPVIADAKPPVIGLPVEFLNAGRKRIFRQFRNLRRNATLDLAVERLEFLKRRRRKLNLVPYR
jgi:hypothetical protein